MNRLEAIWIDRGREPTQPPNPAYPDGIALDLSNGARRTCSLTLAHPTKRCGYWLLQCPVCGLKTVITTAGRPDDPRSVKVACKP